MNQSIKHDAENNCPQRELITARFHATLQTQTTGNDKKLYLFQCHNTHQLSNTGDIGVTEAQQGEQSVCLSQERVEHIQSVLNVLYYGNILHARLHCSREIWLRYIA